MRVCCIIPILKANSKSTTFSINVRIGKTKQLPARLVAERLTQAETNKRCRYIRYRAKRKNENPSKIRLRLAQWNLYITNIEEHLLTGEEICRITGIRWQVELMFKSLKSIARLHVSRSQKSYRILSEIYAKLIAALIRHAVMLVAGWRCLRHSLMKTTRLIMGYARTLTMSFQKSKTAIIQTLEDIKLTFKNASYLQESSGKNTTFRKLQRTAEIH